MQASNVSASTGSQPSSGWGVEEKRLGFKYVEMLRREKDERFEKQLSPERLELLRNIKLLESQYLQRMMDQASVDKQVLQKCIQDMPKKLAKVVCADIRGFNAEAQIQRRQVTEQHKATLASGSAVHRRELLYQHGIELKKIGAQQDLCKQFSINALGLTVSRQADQVLSGNKLIEEREVNYTEIMRDRPDKKKSFIVLAQCWKGRKAAASTHEVALSYEERDPSYDWAQWWMELGGFKALSILSDNM